MTYATDLSNVNQMQVTLSAGALKSVLSEVIPLASKVLDWTHVPTGGSAVCRYNPKSVNREYEIKYQSGDIGNMVHELVHVAVNEAYGRDFINYVNDSASKVPARTLDAVGRCTNEDIRQTKQMDPGANNANGTSLEALQGWAAAALELSVQQRSEIDAKLLYGRMNPQKEYDTVITQVLVWLVQWGYPVIGHQGTKPVVNALFEELSAAVEKAYNARKNASTKTLLRVSTEAR